jgi:acyl-CoA thioesterase
MPFNRLVGVKVRARHKDGITIECPIREELMNLAGTLHGGVTATLADVAVGMAIHNHFEGRVSTTTVELKINYFIPVTGKKVTARSHLLRVGKSLVVARVDIKDENRRLAATALVTYMLLTGRT